MTPYEITLSWPDHPACAEMLEAMGTEVNYHIAGARFREPKTGISSVVRSVPFSYCIAAQVRRSRIGAIAYQRLRSALIRRSVPPGRLIHCCSHLIYGDSPWIGDYENVNVLGFYSSRLLHDTRFVEHLRGVLARPSCRGIRVWSESARQSFQKLFPDEDIRRKLRVIYPSMAFPAEARTIPEKTGLPRILFVAKGFWVKGGALFLEALKKLRTRMDFRADFVCDLPPECEHYRKELAGVVDFYEPHFSRLELFTHFHNRADIFVMLGMADSYGLALLEASAFGLPIVAARLNSGLSDLLRLTGNAIQVEPDHQIFDEFGVHCVEPDELVRRIRADRGTAMVDRIVAVLAMLISDRDRRRELGSCGRTAIREGSLSLANMRRSLLELYSSVMN